MPYNLTSLQEATDPGSLVMWANNATSGLLINLAMLGLYIIMTSVLLRRVDFAKATMVASFSCFFLSGILWYGGMIATIFPLLYLSILSFSALFVYITDRY